MADERVPQHRDGDAQEGRIAGGSEAKDEYESAGVSPRTRAQPLPPESPLSSALSSLPPSRSRAGSGSGSGSLKVLPWSQDRSTNITSPRQPLSVGKGLEELFTLSPEPQSAPLPIKKGNNEDSSGDEIKVASKSSEKRDSGSPLSDLSDDASDTAQTARPAAAQEPRKTISKYVGQDLGGNSTAATRTPKKALCAGNRKRQVEVSGMVERGEGRNGGAEQERGADVLCAHAPDALASFTHQPSTPVDQAANAQDTDKDAAAQNAAAVALLSLQFADSTSAERDREVSDGRNEGEMEAALSLLALRYPWPSGHQHPHQHLQHPLSHPLTATKTHAHLIEQDLEALGLGGDGDEARVRPQKRRRATMASFTSSDKESVQAQPLRRKKARVSRQSLVKEDLRIGESSVDEVGGVGSDEGKAVKGISGKKMRGKKKGVASPVKKRRVKTVY